MPPEWEFDESVLFEVPAEYADKLLSRLAQGHFSWLHGAEDGICVVAALHANSDDLAPILREVESWIAEIGLPYVRFVLDGREYMLRTQSELPAGRAAWDRLRPPH